MPLSDRDKEILHLIEKGLRTEDPKLASRVRRGKIDSPWSPRRRCGLTLFVVGLLMLVTGVAVHATMIADFPILSVLGFTVMFGGAIIGVAARGTNSEDAETVRGPKR